MSRAQAWMINRVAALFLPTLRFDPKTEQFTVHKSTCRNARVRHILGRPDEAWLPESRADKLVVIRE